jgi:Ca-activated chloride channel family protein
VTGRDFELVWQPDLGLVPEATVMAEKSGDQNYALVLVTPPAGMPERIPRETVFIIDSSGSMEGQSMEQARAALLLALDDLGPSDRFNVIDFDSDARRLFGVSQPADRVNVEAAKQYVAGLTADGGTEMLSAIQLALPETVTPGLVRQVIFITDGQVGNEQQLFSYIHSNLGDSRLFTVGIGSAPNSHFMRNAARFGRGTFTFIGDVAQVQERMGEMFAKLGSPVMTAIEVTVSDPTAEVWPQRVPDVYRGEPLVIAVRVSDPNAKVAIRGRIGQKSWTRELALPRPSEERGIAKLWARQKIESAMDRLSEGVEPAVVRGEVVDVAMRHHLVSQYTSLVAVDRTPAGIVAAACKSVEPSETSGAGPEGELPQTATPSRLFMLIGAGLILLSLITMKFVW